MTDQNMFTKFVCYRIRTEINFYIRIIVNWKLYSILNQLEQLTDGINHTNNIT